jgi:hypothetical protein
MCRFRPVLGYLANIISRAAVKVHILRARMGHHGVCCIHSTSRCSISDYPLIIFPLDTVGRALHIAVFVWYLSLPHKLYTSSPKPHSSPACFVVGLAWPCLRKRLCTLSSSCRPGKLCYCAKEDCAELILENSSREVTAAFTYDQGLGKEGSRRYTAAVARAIRPTA